MLRIILPRSQANNNAIIPNDLDVAEDHLGKRLDREVRPYAMAG